MKGCVGVLGLMGRSEEPELSGTISGVASDPGVSSEVGERLVPSDSAEESEVSPSGELGVGPGEGSGMPEGSKLAPEVVQAKSEAVGGGPGVGGDVLGGPAVLSRSEAL